jgi:NADH:ubiquinone oxidoreductase subunit F (NADH-binding)
MSGFLLPETPIRSLDEWLATEVGGLGVQQAQQLGPAGTIEVVRASGLQGRGGAGFPTGRKWATIAGSAEAIRYVAVNGAEGEPGTFKDRALMRANPYQLVEGIIIAGFAVSAREVFICVKASFEEERVALERAVSEMQEAGICRDCKVTIVAGPEEYLFGEEKAMLEVIEGGPPLPRLFPPYEHGLFTSTPQTGWEGRRPVDRDETRPAQSNPTLVNNVETLSNIPHILARGVEWFRSHGTPGSPGTLGVTMSGDVVAPDVGELEMGTPLRLAIDAVGSGLGEGRSVKAVFSGVANPVITADNLDVPLSHEAFRALGSGLGAGGFIVYDDTACMVEVARQFSRFLYVESCGQCPPCKLGSGEITARLDRVEAGVATEQDIGEMRSWLLKVTDQARCALAAEEQLVVSSVLDNFAGEVVEHLELGRCPRPRQLTFPKLVDLRDGHATYSARQHLKQPDWTYADETHPEE